MEFLKSLLSFDVFNLRIVLNCLSSDSIISFKIKAVLGLFASLTLPTAKAGGFLFLPPLH